VEPDLKLAVLPGGVDAGVVALLDPRRIWAWTPSRPPSSWSSAFMAMAARRWVGRDPAWRWQLNPRAP
jgi:hypothetical protein